jgi:hypothetical protein
MYGNTHEIAGNIADGLRSNYEVTLVPVAGAPTHVHGLPSVATRLMAARAAKDGSALRMDPDAGDPGLPEWLKHLGHRDGLAAAFDTRIKGVPVITGRASRAIARLLKRHGYRLAAAPESFLASWETTLLDGEAGRARRWGMTLGTASKACLPARA